MEMPQGHVEFIKVCDRKSGILNSSMLSEHRQPAAIVTELPKVSLECLRSLAQEPVIWQMLERQSFLYNAAKSETEFQHLLIWVKLSQPCL